MPYIEEIMGRKWVSYEEIDAKYAVAMHRSV